MKKKTFKKMLAGISAVAMLSTAMPVSLIADAYSSTNLPSIANGFGSLFDYIHAQTGSMTDSDSSEVIKKSPLTSVDANDDTVGSFDALETAINLKDYTYKLAKYELETATIASSAAGAPGYYATKWDIDAAKDDILAQLKNKDVTDVTFYTADDQKKNSSHIEGTIKTITINMPQTSDEIVDKAHNVEYKPITFTVVRTADDFTTAVDQRGGTVSLILADNLTDANSNEITGVNVQYMDLNLNLNGFNIDTTGGIKVTNKRLRIWGSGTSKISDGGSSRIPVGTALLDTTAAGSRIEIYDNVELAATEGSGRTAPVIKCETGKVLMAGDNVKVNNATNAAKAYVGDGFCAGDYNYTSNGTAAVSSLTDAGVFITRKKHAFNSKGVEVTARGSEDVEKAPYYDADLRDADIDYAYEPAEDVAVSTDHSVANGSLTNNATAKTIGISKPGQLYWLAEQVNNTLRTNDLLVNIYANLDFDGMPKEFTPIDAANFLIKIQGVDAANKSWGTDNAGKVISNISIKSSAIDAETGQENAGLISKTKNAAGNAISYIGIENATVATTNIEDSYAGVFAGEANELTLTNVYALNPTFKKAKYTGSAVAKLHNNSDVQYSYFSAASPVFNSVDVTSATKLNEIISGTATTGKTVYYNSTLYKAASGSQENKLYPATTDDFISGKVAFMLNKHNPNQQLAADAIISWTKDNGDIRLNSLASSAADVASVNGSGYLGGVTLHAAPWNGIYETDIFGQTITRDDFGKITSSTYPTFLKPDANYDIKYTATNRVFRQITTDCSGQQQAWGTSGAQFGNKEVVYTGDHEDKKGDHYCDNCGAYEVEYWFDKDLVPFLSSKDEGNSIDGKFIGLNKIGSMTQVTFDLRKSKTTVAEIVNAINTVDTEGKCAVEGFDILNMSHTSGQKVLSGETPITNVNFIVKEDIICKLYPNNQTPDVAGDDISKIGFRVASGVSRGDAYDTAIPASGASANKLNLNSVGFGQLDETDANVTVVQETRLTKTINTNNVDTYDYYVAADKIDTDGNTTANKSIAFASFKSDKSKFTPKAPRDYTFVIKFNDVKHNDSRDHDTGTKADAKGGWNVDADESSRNELSDGRYEPVGSILLKKADGTGYDSKNVDGTTNGISTDGDADVKVHAFKGDGCGCIIEEAHTNEFAITNEGHMGVCKVCSLALGGALASGAATIKPGTVAQQEDHVYEVVFTTGNLTLQRCTVCGYTTFTKDTNMTVSNPTIEIGESDEGTTYRQKYQFNIAAGDNTILSYGVLYTKDGTAIDNTKYANIIADTNVANTTDANYFDHDGAIRTAKLTADKISYSAKKNIKTGGTYNVSVSQDSMDADVVICGYVVFKDAVGTVAVKKTPVFTKSYREIAENEIENNCSVTHDGYRAIENNTTQVNQKFVTDVENGFIIKKVGLIADKKNAFGSVNNSTKLENMNTDTMAKNEKAPTRIVNTVIYAPKFTKANTAQMARGYAEIEYKGVTHVIYSDAVAPNATFAS